MGSRFFLNSVLFTDNAASKIIGGRRKLRQTSSVEKNVTVRMRIGFEKKVLFMTYGKESMTMIDDYE